MSADEPVERRSAKVPIASFLCSTVAAAALTYVYATGGDPQLEGLLLGVVFAGLGVGFVTWAHRLLPHGPYVEPRPELAASPAQRGATDTDIERPGTLGRRRLLLGSLFAAIGGLATAAIIPLRSLGPRPDASLRHTPWRRGLALVNEQGKVVRARDVPTGGLVTVFPEGHVGSADGQTVLIRLGDGVEPEGAQVEHGFIAFSKICTHAGCPVGLYQAELHQLLCPCHQSAFDVLQNAKPVFGPAARALPRLPIEVDAEGVLRALGDYPEPVGPTWWSR